MTPLFSAYSALAKGLNSVPSTMSSSSQTSVNPALRYPMPSSGLRGYCTHVCKYTHTYTCVHSVKKIKNKIFKVKAAYLSLNIFLVTACLMLTDRENLLATVIGLLNFMYRRSWITMQRVYVTRTQWYFPNELCYSIAKHKGRIQLSWHKGLCCAHRSQRHVLFIIPHTGIRPLRRLILTVSVVGFIIT